MSWPRQILAETASYPFSTVHPNRALVEVPDPRLSVLGDLVGRQQQVKVRTEFIDIAGLVKGASRGEGLGNQFLHQIRECDALLHVLDCFSDPDEDMADFPTDPAGRLHTIHQELMLSDAERLENKMERLQREVKGDRGLTDTLELVIQAMAELEQGIMLRDSPAYPAPRVSCPEMPKWDSLPPNRNWYWPMWTRIWCRTIAVSRAMSRPWPERDTGWWSSVPKWKRNCLTCLQKTRRNSARLTDWMFRVWKM